MMQASTTRRNGFTLVEIMIVVVTIGLLTAMAIPAFNKVRENSRNKAITNNLRQIVAAGMQYIHEEGVTSVEYSDLEDVYFNSIRSVAGEDYSGLVVFETGGVLIVSTVGNQTVEFAY